MNFRFPKNYNYNLKLWGLISYSTAIIDVIIGGILFWIINFIFKSLTMKLYFFIGLYLPIILFSVFGINKESFITVIKYLLKFYKNKKIFLFKKNEFSLERKKN